MTRWLLDAPLLRGTTPEMIHLSLDRPLALARFAKSSFPGNVNRDTLGLRHLR